MKRQFFLSFSFSSVFNIDKKGEDKNKMYYICIFYIFIYLKKKIGTRVLPPGAARLEKSKLNYIFKMFVVHLVTSSHGSCGARPPPRDLISAGGWGLGRSSAALRFATVATRPPAGQDACSAADRSVWSPRARW